MFKLICILLKRYTVWFKGSPYLQNHGYLQFKEFSKQIVYFCSCNYSKTYCDTNGSYNVIFNVTWAMINHS